MCDKFVQPLEDKKLTQSSIIINLNKDGTGLYDFILHVNVYLFMGYSYLELGIMCLPKNTFDIEKGIDLELRISFPFLIENDNFIDVLKDTENLKINEILQIIFNEEIIFNQEYMHFNTKKYKNISILTSSLNNGCITMKLNNDRMIKYGRFRVYGIQSSITENVSPEYFLNRSFLNIEEIFGFSVNTYRNTRNKDIAYDNLVSFNEINTFFIFDKEVKNVECGKNFKGIRVLENKLWDNYIFLNRRNNISSNKLKIVYQYKEIGHIEDFKIFIRTTRVSFRIIYIVYFVFMIVAISIFSNSLYDFLKCLLGLFV